MRIAAALTPHDWFSISFTYMSSSFEGQATGARESVHCLLVPRFIVAVLRSLLVCALVVSTTGGTLRAPENTRVARLFADHPAACRTGVAHRRT